MSVFPHLGEDRVDVRARALLDHPALRLTGTLAPHRIGLRRLRLGDHERAVIASIELIERVCAVRCLRQVDPLGVREPLRNDMAHGGLLTECLGDRAVVGPSRELQVKCFLRLVELRRVLGGGVRIVRLPDLLLDDPLLLFGGTFARLPPVVRGPGTVVHRIPGTSSVDALADSLPQLGFTPARLTLEHTGTNRDTQSIICTKVAIATPCSSGQSSAPTDIRCPAHDPYVHIRHTRTPENTGPTEQTRHPVRSGAGQALRRHERGITTEPHHRFRFILVARRDLP